VVELLWDASALVKRYTLEAGHASVDALFASVPLSQMVATYWGYLETYAAIVRKRNRGEITTAAMRAAHSSLETEVLNSLDFRLLTIEDADILDCILYVEPHNLNSADAAILATYLRYLDAQPPGAPTAVLVAADSYLLRAATAEGLTTLNPETVDAVDIPPLLAIL
jgi:predicted nucleic acid-binding protein